MDVWRGQQGSNGTADKNELLVNAYATVRDLPSLDFPHQLRGRRGLSDPELPSHLSGFAGYVLGRGDGQMTAMRYHLWRHIQRVRNQVAFLVEAGDLLAVTAWAQRANAIPRSPRWLGARSRHGGADDRGGRIQRRGRFALST